MLNKLLLISFMLLSCSTIADTLDFTKDIIIDAKEQALDINANKLTFSGDVEISQGALRMKADRLDIIKGENGQTDTLIAFGHPATYQQTLTDGKILNASANKIIYLVKQKVLTLDGNATVAQADSKVSSDKIEYDLVAQNVSATISANSKKKVRTVLTPQQ